MRGTEGSPVLVLTVRMVPYENQCLMGGRCLWWPTGLLKGQHSYLLNFVQSLLSSIGLHDHQRALSWWETMAGTSAMPPSTLS